MCSLYTRFHYRCGLSGSKQNFFFAVDNVLNQHRHFFNVVLDVVQNVLGILLSTVNYCLLSYYWLIKLGGSNNHKIFGVVDDVGEFCINLSLRLVLGLSSHHEMVVSFQPEKGLVHLGLLFLAT